jgi:alpha-tubulin suppressor-like RCC1 family protein
MIASGRDHTLVIDLEDRVWGFGRIAGSVQLTPVFIQDLKAKAIACGSNYSLIVDLEGDVWGPGENDRGQLGLGSEYYIDEPTKIPDFKAVAVSAGYNHSLMIGTMIR